MHYDGKVYRPPFESNALLLQVTVGCSHNSCNFCTMYRDIDFRMEPMEQIAADLDEAREYCPDVKRIFLLSGDAFCLSGFKLQAIAKLIHQKLPKVETIAMYASINNIKSKTDAELRMLRKLGINQLNIGLESGVDEILKAMNKGFTAKEAETQLIRLKNAGIEYGANIIFGLGGPELRREHAIKTAEILNKAHPFILFTGTIHASPGCPLYDQMQSGQFKECTMGEYLEEEELFFQHLDVDQCFMFGLHPSNAIRLQGWLGRDREKLLEFIAERRNSLTQKQLDTIPKRKGEGGIVDEEECETKTEE